MDNLDKVRARQKAQSEKTERKNTTSSSGRTAPSRAPSAGKRSAPAGAAGRPGEGDARRSSSRSAQTDGPSIRQTVTRTAEAPHKAPRKKRRRKKSKYAWIFTTIKVLILIAIAVAIGVGAWIFSVIDLTFGDDLSSMNLNISSKVYYTDEDGEVRQYAQFNASQNRVWVPIDKMPLNIQNAIVAIEDQRFYQHRGVDLKRTAGAALNYLFKGDSSYGGSTITQQLVKNITEDKSRDASRKVREITRSIVLETKLSKEQILELYLNTIYLSQGTNGVEAAANVYFSKNVSDLTLSECACIAGITQYPSKYDPITQPEANEEKRLLVLKKMFELEYIDKDEYEQAVNEKIQLNVGEVKKRKIQSYFLDHLFEEIRDDLVKKGYTDHFAENMIYNGGLKIYSTVNPDIQETLEEYFENPANFSAYGGSDQPQAAMIISDPKNGEIKGIVGGRGEKNYNRGLNRATQSKRQPGSSIKPIAVYAPAVDLGLITPSTIVDDSPIDIGGWKPKNSGGGFRGSVSVQNALTWSYNIPAVKVLEELTVEKSFDYMKNRLHVDSLVNSRVSGDTNYSDKTLPSLALGGLTDGVTLIEMNGAYSTFANEGEYIEPHTYTKVYDVEGKVVLEKKPNQNKAFSSSTAFMMNEMLKSVVTSGTGGGAKIDNIDTCGKTGTTDNSKDRWFIGYTPYYVASVWFGYDEPRSISSSGNPALKIWKAVMSQIHKPLPAAQFEMPDTVKKATVCQRTGYAPGPHCTPITQYADAGHASQKCTGNHGYIGTRPYMEIPAEETDEGEEGAEGEETPENLGPEYPIVPLDELPREPVGETVAPPEVAVETPPPVEVQ